MPPIVFSKYLKSKIPRERLFPSGKRSHFRSKPLGKGVEGGGHRPRKQKQFGQNHRKKRQLRLCHIRRLSALFSSRTVKISSHSQPKNRLPSGKRAFVGDGCVQKRLLCRRTFHGNFCFGQKKSARVFKKNTDAFDVVFIGSDGKFRSKAAAENQPILTAARKRLCAAIIMGMMTSSATVIIPICASLVAMTAK